MLLAAVQGLVKMQLRLEDVSSIVDTLESDFKIERVQTQTGDEDAYRPALSKLPDKTEFNDIPCGRCPVRACTASQSGWPTRGLLSQDPLPKQHKSAHRQVAPLCIAGCAGVPSGGRHLTSVMPLLQRMAHQATRC